MVDTVIVKLVLTTILAAIVNLTECQNTEPTSRCTCNTNAYSNSAKKTVSFTGTHGCDITLSCDTGYTLDGGPTKVYCENGIWIDEENEARDLSTYTCKLNGLSVGLAVAGIACVAILVSIFIYCAISCNKKKRRSAPEPVRTPANNNISYEKKLMMTQLSELEEPEYSKPIPARRPLDIPKDRTIERPDRTDRTLDRLTSTPKKEVTNSPPPYSEPTSADDKRAMIDELEKGDKVGEYTAPEYEQNVSLDFEDDTQDTMEESLDGMMNNSHTKLTRL